MQDMGKAILIQHLWHRLQDHVYFQLEASQGQVDVTNTSHCPSNDEIIPESAYDDQIDLPIYQDADDFPSSSQHSFHNPLGDHDDDRARCYDNHQYDETSSDVLPPPIYQEITKPANINTCVGRGVDIAMAKNIYDTLT